MNTSAILFLVIFIEVISLYFFSRKLTQQLFHLFYRLTHSHNWTVKLIALIFLPGTLIHELAHAITAGVLFVDTGEITLWPEVREDSVKLGSVEVYETDALRRSLIGFAPVFVGIGLIIGSLWLLTYWYQTGGSLPIWAMLIFIYTLFVIGNTMFSSKKDLEGAVGILLTILLFTIGAYAYAVYQFPGIDNSIFTPSVASFIERANLSLLSLIIVDVLIIGLLKLVLAHHRR